MSILIKGMKMPKSCMNCPLFESKYHFHGCHAKPESFSDMDMWNFFVGDRPSWCPLFEVPTPHGRLIDADALMLKIKEYIDEYSDLDADGLHNFKWCAMKEAELAIIDAPTIIEAEGGGSDV